MTATSTAATADDNPATAPADGSSQPQRGIARVREEECYYLTGLAANCLREAEHLVQEVHNGAMARTTDFRGDKGITPLDYQEINRTLREAEQCAHLAVRYLQSMVCSSDPWAQEPAF